MTRYENGRAPLSDLVYLGPDFYLPSGTAARWRELQRLAWEKYGVWLVPTEGWNGYRPLAIQYEYREELGVWAAVPGTSSHGLTFNGRDCAAVDVNNWRALAAAESLAWARFVALCRIVGFTVDFVTPRELWHIGDFDPFTVPAFAAIAINPRPVTEEEQIMGVKEEIIDGVAAKLDTRRDTAVVWVGGDAFVVDDAAGTKWNVARGQARVEDAFAFIDWLRARGFTEYKNQAPFVLAGYRDITEEGSVREEVARALREAATAASVE